MTGSGDKVSPKAERAADRVPIQSLEPYSLARLLRLSSVRRNTFDAEKSPRK